VRRILLPIALAFALGLTACSTSAGELPPSRTAPATPSPSASASTPAPRPCNAEQSYDLQGSPLALPQGSRTIAAIKSRQPARLIAGVSADTLLLGARNPINGQIEGFDIDMVHAVAKAILGNPNKIEFRVITAAQRIPSLQDHSVDIVARAMTATCARWQLIKFSTIYYVATQKVLVAKGSKANGLQDMSGEKVCAPKGTTTLDNLKKLYPKVVAVPVDLHTDCLALFQQGKVDGITGDDTILAGFAAQDPYARVVGGPIGDPQPYGLGIAKDDKGFTQYVNGVLARMRSDGEWQTSYNQWLRPALGPKTPPTPQYGRSLP
jgi:polar amino acid transport system substrate-binding protein